MIECNQSDFRQTTLQVIRQFKNEFIQARRQNFTTGGAKDQKGGAHFQTQYNIGCMQQPEGKTWNGVHRFQMGEPGNTAPPLATALNLFLRNKRKKYFVNTKFSSKRYVLKILISNTELAYDHLHVEWTTCGKQLLQTNERKAENQWDFYVLLLFAQLLFFPISREERLQTKLLKFKVKPLP